jgi:hypothetical protein
VNAIAPGPTDTEATRTIVPPPILKQLLAQMPLARLGETGGPRGNPALPSLGRVGVDDRAGGERGRRAGHAAMNAETRNLIDGRLVDSESVATFPNGVQGFEEYLETKVIGLPARR